MKREFVGYVISYFSENMQKLTQNGLAGNRDFLPTLTIGLQKLKMYVHAKYLCKLFWWFEETNYSVLENQDLSTSMEKLYNETLKEYYDKKLDFSGYTYNEFWHLLLVDKNIPESEYMYYENTKIQTCIFWQAMNVLFPNWIASSPLYYHIEPDQYEIGSQLPAETCENYYLEKAVELITNQKIYIPVQPDWKNSKDRAAFELSYKRNGELKKTYYSYLPKKKTLGNIWRDFDIAQWIINEELINSSICFHYIQTDLAQALAELQAVLTYYIHMLATDKDFSGEPWENLSINDEEKTTIDRLHRIIENLTEENEQYSAFFLNRSKEYSQGDLERKREIIGEELIDNPIIIPTAKQRQEYPKCRWIVQESSLIESTIRNWKESCEKKKVGFWKQRIIKKGLFIKTDDTLFPLDPSSDKKVSNGFLSILDRMN